MSRTSLKRSPPIGLALGSGVARGWAHIGVLQKLIEAGLAPDIIAGTSIGAVVGGAYAASRLSEIEDFALDLTKRNVFGLMDLRIGGAGLFAGRHLTEQLHKHFGGMEIEKLSKQFIAVATELATGHEIWLRRGSLVDALRASYALPGLFAPVHFDGSWLIDGALVNPVPSSVCRAFGARVVIAVNLNRDAFGKASTSKPVLAQSDPKNAKTIEDMDNNLPSINKKGIYRTLMRQIFGTSQKMPGMTTVLLASLNIVQDRLARSRLAGDPPDINIEPRVGHISLLEFNRAEEAIELGAQATESALPFIREVVELLT